MKDTFIDKIIPSLSIKMGILETTAMLGVSTTKQILS